MKTIVVLGEGNEGVSGEVKNVFSRFCEKHPEKTVEQHLILAISRYLSDNGVEILDLVPDANNPIW